MKKLKKITPVKHHSLVDKVEVHILEYFRENNFMPGDNLPNEIEFADSLGVSRTVIREALVRLKTLGLVDSRKQRGMVYTEPDIINNFERILNPDLLGNETLKNLFEIRLTLEIGMADLLFSRKSNKDIKDLEKIVEQEEANQSNSDDFRLQTEIKFHSKLYQISANGTLQGFQNLLLPIFEFVRKQYPNRTKEYSNKNKKTHRDILNELKAGTPSTFIDTMRGHLMPHFDKIFYEE